MRKPLSARRRLLPACLAVVGLALTVACSSEDSSDGATEFDESGGQAEAADRSANNQSIVAPAAQPQVPTELALIKTGSIALESTDVDKLLVDLDRVVATYDGVVESEDVRTDDEGAAESASAVVRVPVDRFEDAVEAIAELGTLVRQQSAADDVTTRVADIDARVASAQRSIASLQRLFDRAAKLSDVIALETELAQRQADLESLQAQQRSLARQTALSTIQVSVDRADVTPPEDEDATGFVAGLEDGWSGLVTFVGGAVHVVGLVLPLGTLALLVAAPVWLVVRRWRPVGRS